MSQLICYAFSITAGRNAASLFPLSLTVLLSAVSYFSHLSCSICISLSLCHFGKFWSKLGCLFALRALNNCWRVDTLECVCVLVFSFCLPPRHLCRSPCQVAAWDCFPLCFCHWLNGCGLFVFVYTLTSWTWTCLPMFLILMWKQMNLWNVALCWKKRSTILSAGSFFHLLAKQMLPWPDQDLYYGTQWCHQNKKQNRCSLLQLERLDEMVLHFHNMSIFCLVYCYGRSVASRKNFPLTLTICHLPYFPSIIRRTVIKQPCLGKFYS